MALSKPISMDTLKKNIISVEETWKGKDGVFDVEYRYKRTYQFTNGKLYEKVEQSERQWERGKTPSKWKSGGRPLKYAVKRNNWDDTLMYINSAIKTPTHKGYFDEYPQKGTWTAVVTKTSNNESLVEKKSRKTTPKKTVKKTTAKKTSLKSMLSVLKRRK